MTKDTPTPYMYRLEKNGTYTPLTKAQYQAESTSAWTPEYQRHVLELIRKVNNA